MSRFTRLEVYEAMVSTGLVPLFYHPAVEICTNVTQACANGGACVFEFTNRGDFAFDVSSSFPKSWPVKNPH